MRRFATATRRSTPLNASSLVVAPRRAQFSTSTLAPAPPKPPLTDEYGTRRRALPPLDLAGRPVPSPPAPTTPPPKPEPPKLKRKTRSVKAAPPPPVEEAELEEDLEELDPVAAPLHDLDAPVTTALEASIRADLARYPDAILLTQVGSFFESYFDQAPHVAQVLGIKLTSKQFGKKGSKTRHSFAGFPLSQLAKHTSTLVEEGHKVVVVEEFKRSGLNGPTTREVTRVVTPGTGIDEAFVKMDQVSFVLAVGVLPRRTTTSEDEVEDQIGLAYRDISTGSSFTRTSSLASLRDDILLVAPAEIVIPSTLPLTHPSIHSLLLAEKDRQSYMLSTTAPLLSLPPSSTPESAASATLLSYLASTLPTTPPPRIEPQSIDPSSILQMDSTTLKSLEIRESLRGGLKGSLISTVRRTSTPGGARLLLQRLCAPSTSLLEINSRLSLVAAFHAFPPTRRYLSSLLRTLDDTSRVLQRLYLRRSGSAFHLLSLKRTLVAIIEIRQCLEEIESSLPEGGSEKKEVKELRERLEEFGELREAIEGAVDEEALLEREREEEKKRELVDKFGVAGVKDIVSAGGESEEEGERRKEGLWGKEESWVVRPDFSPALAELHGELVTKRRAADQLEKTLAKQYGIRQLSLKIVPKFGAIAHIASKGPSKMDDQFVVVVKSGSTRSYVVPEWSVLSAEIASLTKEIIFLENETTKIIVAGVLDRYEALSSTVQALDELDVSIGFAELATEMTLVRPVVDERTALTIVAGRHPTVEHSLKVQGRAFTSNSVHFEHPSSFVHVLTGPNMAGKSTFLRQTALIVLLAQAGSFVPADKVEMGVVDKIFSRVGARDELDRDRSTFMIEMDEATGILNSATERSLVLLDELGRGTSPLDGLAIAYAALEHLVHVNKSRTLFATHYHRLGELLGYDEQLGEAGTRGRDEWEGVEFWCTDVEEAEDSVTYRHELRRGLNDDSAGIIIARLSGMPERAVRTAMELRERYR